ncbi:DUF4239 domain-containing protein [Altererythrobacter sp. Root672]|uniref:bestrophin-like domain n=1 Tax=Altererythrobacter sp. Root672 TaxID=1736584 RepID=UPI0006F513F1|nr:DUF4239 domain-containing protein [Altererythrobacter sp. Root672]KRA81580.1 hypothetical protein ASD76_13690 [Altererythrobacter sp. Root672]
MTLVGNWILSEPLWFVFVGLLVCLVLSALLGYFLRRWVSPGNDERSDQEGYIFSAVMGLLALLVGFTFSLAIDRFDNRRTQVLLEANAIGTTYLRAQLLKEPHRTEISNLLTAYVDNRITLGKAEPGPEGEGLVARSDALLTDLWKATVAAYPSIEGTPLAVTFVNTMNDMIDMDAARKAARRTHVPPQVFALLFIYQIITAGVIGYVMTGRNGRKVSAFLLFLFALSVILIIDLDSPTTGSIRESQRPMEDLQQSLHAQPAGSYDPVPTPQPS